VLAGSRVEFLEYVAEHANLCQTTTYVYVHDLVTAHERHFDSYIRVGTFYNRGDATEIALAVFAGLKGRT